MWQALFSVSRRMERHPLYRSLRGGLIMMIPVLLIGAFALALQSLPVPMYVSWIQTFADGMIYRVLNVIYAATFQLLAVYTTIFIGLSFSRESNHNKRVDFGSVAAALISFFIMSGSNAKTFTLESLGPKGMFIAIFSGMMSSAIYWMIKDYTGLKIRLHSDGTDAQFNGAIRVLPPLVLTIMLFALFDAAICDLCDVECVYQLFIRTANALFALPMSDTVRAGMYIFLSGLLWFFGIHGSDCLEGVAAQYFVPATDANVAAVAAGGAPTHIFTKGFFDSFVLMGGCGTAICLLMALLLFSRRRSSRAVSKLAAIPMLFNINEIMVFGLPVILNPFMLIPFLTVPLVSFAISYFAMSSGLVPLISVSVEWTTPILLGGYLATGSMAGLLLQLVNLVVGTAIYAPFIKLLDIELEYAAQDNYRELVELLQASEREGKEITLGTLEGYAGAVAKALSDDFLDALACGRYEMFYQPQYNYDGDCIGVEALLRWKHPAYGFVYPPLAVKLAEEAGRLLQLDCGVFDKVLQDAPRIRKRFGADAKISINVTGNTISQQSYAEHVCRRMQEEAGKKANICLEVTEQTAIHFDVVATTIFNQIKAKGIQFAIDDFSMGQTSIDYLKGNIFSLIKLDGSLTKGILDNSNCYEIVSSISGLAKSLGIQVLAEYVETAQQREALHRAGCEMYQGYLYSPAISLEPAHVSTEGVSYRKANK